MAKNARLLAKPTLPLSDAQPGGTSKPLYVYGYALIRGCSFHTHTFTPLDLPQQMLTCHRSVSRLLPFSFLATNQVSRPLYPRRSGSCLYSHHEGGSRHTSGQSDHPPLSRARAARARSWLFPAPVSAAAGTGVAARAAAKQKQVVAVRLLHDTSTRRNSMFLGVIRR